MNLESALTLAAERRIVRVRVETPGYPVREETVLLLWPLPPRKEGDNSVRLDRPDGWTMLYAGRPDGAWYPGVVYVHDATVVETLGEAVPAVDLREPVGARDGLRFAEAVALAARFDVRCRFGYRAKDASPNVPPQERDATPLGARGDLLFAQDHARNATRSFKFDGVSSLHAQPGAPVPRWDADLGSYCAPPAPAASTDAAPWETDA